ncbi:50S ribosomal protein L18 [Candidatus Woesearchaeota archaeon]|nr:50S ribosomal protein L18 [Candidatus Woesearchaeota archaeon]MBW3021511.1 50S ribosomal protein L18 [Candidatus Woesearchaeota archaeon]
MKGIAFRRKREGKTNYKKRLKLLLSKKPRLVIRRSLKNIVAQIVEFDPKGDKVVACASSRELKKKGWKLHGGNIVTGYLVGYLLGKKAKVKEAVLDIGLQSSVKGSCIYGVLKGVLDSGIKVPHSEEVLPKEERVRGKHIADYAAKLKQDKGAYEKQFSKMLKEGIDPEKMEIYFDEMKKKIGA